MILIPLEPNAGPIGGAGLAWPPLHCSFTKPEISFAILILFGVNDLSFITTWSPNPIALGFFDLQGIGPVDLHFLPTHKASAAYERTNWGGKDKGKSSMGKALGEIFRWLRASSFELQSLCFKSLTLIVENQFEFSNVHLEARS